MKIHENVHGQCRSSSASKVKPSGPRMEAASSLEAMAFSVIDRSKMGTDPIGLIRIKNGGVMHDTYQNMEIQMDRL